jgi:hypothetical protein
VIKFKFYLVPMTKKEISKELVAILKGRFESELTIHDEYWERRAELHQRLEQLKEV